MFVQTNTVRAAKHYFRDRLSEQFTESELRSMFREALINRLQISTADYLLADDLLLSESDLLYFRSIVKRLQQHEPFQYIIGFTEFCGFQMICDKRALIPRPETEELVQWIAEEHKTSSGLHVLDLCTGSGCIPIALEKLLKNPLVSAMELSEEALKLAAENISKHDSQVTLIKGDVLNAKVFMQFEVATFDVWVSNPPYVLASDAEQMHENVLKYEPHMALFVDDKDALLFYRKIAEIALVYLKPGGKLYFEIHEQKGKELVLLLKDLGFNRVELRADLQGKDRMIRAVRG